MSARRLLFKFGTLVPAPGGPPEWLDAVGDEGTELDVHHVERGTLLASEAAARPWLAADLRVARVIEMLTLFGGAAESGVLKVRSDEVERSLFLEAGEFVGARSTDPTDRLGEVLWRSGEISLDQLVIATESLEPGTRIGRTLIDLGFIDGRALRESLWSQARAIFLGACLMRAGSLSFIRGERTDNPVRWGVPLDELLDEAVVGYGELERLSARVAPLDAPVVAKVPAPTGKLEEACEALIQLVMSSKETFSRGALLDRAKLGELEGLRALTTLLDGGYFEPIEESAGHKPSVSRLRLLISALNRVRLLLEETQGGPGATVRGFLDNPPEHLAEALSGISLDEALEAESIELQAGFADGGIERMERALVALLDFVLFEARDTLPDDTVDRLDEEIEHLGVFS